MANHRQAYKYAPKQVLPKDWRQQVAEVLKNEGIDIHPQVITNLLNGSRNNPDLTSKILLIRQKIAKRHLAAIRKLNKLRKAA